MAAEKLTKGRLAQILLMLVVLSTAFFWKTMKFESNQVIHCNLDSQCNFQIESHKVQIDQVGEGAIAIHSELPMTIFSKMAVVEVEQHKNEWHVYYPKTFTKLDLCATLSLNQKSNYQMSITLN